MFYICIKVNKNIYIDKYLLGDRLDVMRSIPDNQIDLIITSPPYNVGIEYKNHTDILLYDDYLLFLFDTWKESKRILKNGGRIAINIPSITYKGEYKALYVDVINQMNELGLIMRGEILWYKQNISNRTAWGSWKSPSNPYLVQPYEFVLIFSNGEKKHFGDKDKIDITKKEFIEFSNSFWHIKPETRLGKNHPAPFPEKLVYRLLKFYTYKEDIVLDMFGGSGTVPLVCQKTNRHFVYIDNSEEYLSFAKSRTSQYTLNLI